MTKAMALKVTLLLASAALAGWAVVIGIDRFGRTITPLVDQAHIAEWVARLQDPDPDIRDVACRKLIAIGEPAIPLLLPLVEGEDRIGKEDATYALLSIRSEATVPTIIHLVKTGEPRVRRQAIESLGVLGPRAREAVPTLHELVRSRQVHHIERLGGSCFLPMALARIQEAEAVPILIEILGQEELRLEAVDALAFIGSAARCALPALEAIAREESPNKQRIILLSMEAIRLSGTWMMTAIERDGKIRTTQDVAAPIHWVITENKWCKGPVDKVNETGFLHVDPLKNPKTMDLRKHAVGTADRRFFIYEIDADTLKLCGVENGSDPGLRPSTFGKEQKPDVIISHWKRIK